MVVGRPLGATPGRKVYSYPLCKGPDPWVLQALHNGGEIFEGSAVKDQQNRLPPAAVTQSAYLCRHAMHDGHDGCAGACAQQQHLPLQRLSL